MIAKPIQSLALLVLLVSVSAGIGSLAVAEATTDTADVARGEELFSLCSQCHGENGGGNHAVLAPDIAGLPAWYVEMQLKNFRKGIRGLHHADTGGLRMYPMSKWLQGEDDIANVAAYVASMPKVDAPDELPEEGDAAKGQGYYAVCTACHGPDASGNQGMGAPPLAGMSDWYLYDSIQKYKNRIRGSAPGDPFGAAMQGMVGTLPNDQAVLDVIAHIESLEKKKKE